MKPVILINRTGGTAAADPDIGATVRQALGAANVHGDVELLDGPAIATRACEAVAAGAPLIVVGGGDGSISAAAAAIAGSPTRLGILPLGTLNHLARDLGIPSELTAAAAVIGAGAERRIDVAELNGRVFVNNSAIGLYPLMVIDRELEQHRRHRSKRTAMILASARAIARIRHYRVTICAEGRRTPIETSLLFVGNNDYEIALPSPGKRNGLDDGRLCVLALRKQGRLGLLATALRALIGRSRSEDMIRLDAVEELRIESRRRRLTVSIDGETAQMQAPLTYRIRKRALAVLAPPISAKP